VATGDFFELGGHSLLVFKLIDACSRELRRRPSVADVFSAPTPRRLAARLATTGDRAESVLVPLAPAQGRPTLVFVHAASGSALPFLELVRHFRDEFDVYGIESPDDARDSSAGSIEGMAQLYLAAVDAVRDGRPFFLAGWSMGGCIAVEMAREWRRRGEPPVATILLDTWTPPVALDSREDAAAVRNAILDLNVLGMEGISEESDTASPEEFARLRRVLDRNRHAFLDYQPTYYDGPIDLVCSTEDLPETENGFPEGYLDDDRGWDDLSADIDIYRVPGNHFSMLASANAAELAVVVKQIMETRSNLSDAG
jgi:thioesterase domain-containing protein